MTTSTSKNKLEKAAQSPNAEEQDGADNLNEVTRTSKLAAADGDEGRKSGRGRNDVVKSAKKEASVMMGDSDSDSEEEEEEEDEESVNEDVSAVVKKGSLDKINVFFEAEVNDEQLEEEGGKRIVANEEDQESDSSDTRIVTEDGSEGGESDSDAANDESAELIDERGDSSNDGNGAGRKKAKGVSATDPDSQSNAKSEDVMQMNARYFMMDDVVCKNCGLKGHLSYDCPEEPEEVRCFLCGMAGHESRTCPKEPCFYCGKPGHRQRGCELKTQDMKRGIFRRTAVQNRVVIQVRKIEPPRTDVKIFCYVCGKMGHLDCSLGRAPPALLSCYNCGRRGHTGSQCRDPTVEEMAYAVGEIERKEKQMKMTLQRKKHLSKDGRFQKRGRRVSIVSTSATKTIDKKSEQEKLEKEKRKARKKDGKESTSKKKSKEIEKAALEMKKKEHSREWHEQVREIASGRKADAAPNQPPMRRRRYKDYLAVLT